jgi:hypothetical protein
MEEDEESKKRSMESAVADEESRKRGKRMMGILLKTLTEFKNEVDKPSDSDIKRAQVMQSVNEKLKLDKAEQARINERERQEKREKEDWERKEVEERVSCEFQEALESLQLNRKSCLNYLKTEAKPSLFYLPVKFKEIQIEKLDEAKQKFKKNEEEKEDKAKDKDQEKLDKQPVVNAVDATCHLHSAGSLPVKVVNSTE